MPNIYLFWKEICIVVKIGSGIGDMREIECNGSLKKVQNFFIEVVRFHHIKMQVEIREKTHTTTEVY
jgi:hypothetical protein